MGYDRSSACRLVLGHLHCWRPSAIPDAGIDSPIREGAGSGNAVANLIMFVAADAPDSAWTWRSQPWGVFRKVLEPAQRSTDQEGGDQRMQTSTSPCRRGGRTRLCL